MRVCFIQAAALNSPTTRSISPQLLVGSRITFLPCLCHWGKYIQPWPLKGCEKSTVGRPASISLLSAGASPSWPERWMMNRASASFSFAANWPDVRRGDRVAADEHHVAELLFQIGEVLIELRDFFGRVSKVGVAGAAGKDLVDFGRARFWQRRLFSGHRGVGRQSCRQ